jgi:HAD superfamily hydrolase (TIGR01509 family)
MTLIIFDCDGVLVDSEILFNMIVAEALTEHGYPIDTDTAIARFTGMSMPSLLAIVEGELGRRLPKDFTAQCRARANSVLDGQLRPIEGIDIVLTAHEGPRCVASSSSPTRIRRSLKTTGLDRHFADETLFSAAMVAHGKPAPDLFLHAAAEMGAAPDACIVIEDSLFGVEAAVAAGMTVLGFVGASHIQDGHAARMREAGVAVVFDDMTKLPEHLEKFSSR